MYTRVEIFWKTPSDEKAEIIMALLGELPFDTFENTSKSVDAYIPSHLFSDEVAHELNRLKIEFGFNYKTHSIAYTNWNAEWEKNYEPVIVSDFVAVRADFHAAISGVEHEIVINPKMAFGTGHHATTFSVMEMMRELDFKDKTVFDFGCGSGVLAILAEKLGANYCFAIDYDANCIENTIENAQINNCKTLKAELALIENTDSTKFDIIIANINRNVLTVSMPKLADRLKKDGLLIMSGFYNGDEELLITTAMENKLHLKSVKQKDGWSCLLLSC